ncbi:MAG: gldN [Bacteroidetes bacterium]|nr:gldN [Bacteroidota bacterium]
MNSLRSLLVLICGIAAMMPHSLLAQEEPLDRLPWQERDRAEHKPLPYEYVREADVMWSKKIWRTIDTRQKMNLSFVYPQRPLAQILHTAAMRGDITAYDPTVENADQFKQVMSAADVAVIGVRKDTVIFTEPVSQEDVTKVVINELTWDQITKFKIKEVWFFDTKTSSMQVRIIGIAPVMEDKDANGNVRGDRTMYWLYYPDLRDMLAREEAFEPKNDMKALSWEDMLESRRFESYIYKESNVYDRAIAEYASGKDIQLEADRIKNEMMEFEHDQWSY